MYETEKVPFYVLVLCRYGYVCNTDLKFLAVVRDLPLKDNDVKVVRHLFEPFFVPLH